MRRYFVFLIIALALGVGWYSIGAAFFLNGSAEYATRSYITAVRHQDESALAHLTCEAAQGRPPEDTTLYRLLDKWNSRWKDPGVAYQCYEICDYPDLSTHRTIDNPTRAYVTLSGNMYPVIGSSYSEHPASFTLPLVFEQGHWRVCDLGSGELQITTGPKHDPAPTPAPPVYRIVRKDSDYYIEKNGGVSVRETIEYDQASGQPSGGYAEIPLDRADDISVPGLWVDGVSFTLQAAPSETPGTFRVSRQNEKLRIDWYGPVSTERRRTVQIRYAVVGGLRIDPQGDQFQWPAVRSEEKLTTDSVSAVVHFPTSVAWKDLKFSTTGYSATVTSAGPFAVVFSAEAFPAGSKMELSLQFPHGLVSAQPPAWQVREDALRLTSTPE